METVRGDPYGNVSFERHDDRWVHWPVHWTPVWVGALAALATALLIGLIASAIGAHEVGPSSRIVTYHDIRFGALVFGVLGAFLSFFAGGWIASRIAGIRRSEPAMLHGAIVWLVTIPLLLALLALGANSLFGGWYGGLAGTPAWVTPSSAIVTAPVTTTTGTVGTTGTTTVRPAPSNAPAVADPDAARAARNSALGALTALLLGLMGSVIGGWAASGEPMTFTHYRTRTRTYAYPHEAAEPVVTQTTTMGTTGTTTTTAAPTSVRTAA